MILVALGANLPSSFGAPQETLAEARREMAVRGLRILCHSRTWLTAPVPVSDQPWYHNEVAAIETGLPPFGVMQILQGIEQDFGRVRGARNEARLLDLDLLAYHDEVMNESFLTLPHPRLQERAFVLRPLQEVAPDWIHPVLGRNVETLIRVLPPDQEVRPL